MNLIVAGSRDFDDYALMVREIDKFRESVRDLTGKDVERIISGTARGADRLGELYAREHYIQVIPMAAAWDDLDVPGAVIRTNKFGKLYNAVAGHQRNERMAQAATHCIVFWDGVSTGTSNMIGLARQYKLHLCIVNTTTGLVEEFLGTPPLRGE